MSNKNLLSIIMLSSLVLLQGCSNATDPELHKKVSTSTVKNSDNISSVNVTQDHSLRCIDELRSLTVLSPDDYSKLVSLFKEVSILNQTYKSVEYNANPDSLAMMKMAIESKTKVLCGKVKYYSVMSVDNKINGVNVL